MIYQSAEEQVKDQKGEEVIVFRLATVTSLHSSGRAYVQFYGENAPSGKLFTYIDGYIPAVNDKVLMARQGNTYIMLGSVLNSDVVVKWAAVNHNHDNSYSALSHNHSSIINGTKNFSVDSSGSLLPSTSGQNFGSSSYPVALMYATEINIDGENFTKDKLKYTYAIYDSSAVPSAKESSKIQYIGGAFRSSNSNNSISIGSSSYKFSAGYFNSLYISTLNIGSQAVTLDDIMYKSKLYDEYKSGAARENSKLTYYDGAFRPYQSQSTVTLGASYYPFANGYFTKVHVGDNDFTEDELASTIFDDTKTSSTRTRTRIMYTGGTLRPVDTYYNVSLGSSSYPYYAGYFKTVYQNGAAVTTSDKRKKKSIKNLAQKYITMFKKLRPVTFKYKDGKRVHTGFIAQEVESAMKEAEITREEFAGFVEQENGELGLRYEDFIPIQTAVLQDLMNRIEQLENKVKELERSKK